MRRRVIGQCKATTTRDWTAILDLATRWKFNDIRDLAIRELASVEIDPVEKIELQQQYGIRRQWAHGAYIALCTRPHALDIIEARQLGIETTVKVAFARCVVRSFSGAVSRTTVLQGEARQMGQKKAR